MIHRGHAKEVQTAFCVAGSSTPALCLCLGSRNKDAHGHLLWGSNKAGSGKALLTHLLNPHGEGCQR